MKQSLQQLVAGITLAAFLTAGLPSPAQAGLIGSAAVIEAAAGSARATHLAEVQATLARADVQQQLQAWGVDPSAAADRAAALSDSELADLSAHIAEQPAGGLLELLGLIFVVLLVLDYTGVTKIFRHR